MSDRMKRDLDAFVEEVMRMRPEGINLYITRKQPTELSVELTIEASVDKLYRGDGKRSS